MFRSFSATSKSIIPKSIRPGNIRNMATASKVQLSTDVGDWPEYYRGSISQEQAKKASELLQENHDNHHIFFNPMGLHNHVAHHLLAIWALNASPDVLQKAYDKNKLYQRPKPSAKNEIINDLSDKDNFIEPSGRQRGIQQLPRILHPGN